MNKGMDSNQESRETSARLERRFQEGVDFYYENGLMVLTAKFLKDRGYCCGSGCRHCPYPESGVVRQASNRREWRK